MNIPESLLKTVLDAVMIDWEEANDAYRNSQMGRATEEQYRAKLNHVILPAVIKWYEEDKKTVTDKL